MECDAVVMAVVGCLQEGGDGDTKITKGGLGGGKVGVVPFLRGRTDQKMGTIDCGKVAKREG